MKNLNFSLILCIISIMFIPLYLNAEEVNFAGGTGQEVDPYQIETCEQLALINNSEYLTGGYYYVLNNNITCSSFSPIGESDSDSFIGHFDGKGKIISGLQINKPESFNIGLFGKIRNSTIKNLGLENLTITGRIYTGGLVGRSEESQIENCFVEGNVSGGDYIGLLVGLSYLTHIENTYALGSVSGKDKVGGLVGHSTGEMRTSIYNSYSDVIVSGQNSVGGIVGISIKDPIGNSFSLGTVEGESDVGGLIGELDYDEGESYTTYVINSGWYEYDPEIGLKAIGSEPEVQVSYKESNKATFYSKNHGVYNGWDFSTPVWYEWKNKPPLFTKQPEETKETKPKRRKTGSMMSANQLSSLNNINVAPKISQDKSFKTELGLISRTLKLSNIRMSGDDIKLMQEFLNKSGYSVSPLSPNGLEIDGVYGSKTYTAVKAFQKANNLIEDGIVGTKTIEMMISKSVN